jgi:uncharacterized protein YjbJ (UPF0337 family)
MRSARPGNQRVTASPGARDEGKATVSGEGDQAKGRIKQAVGDLTDDDELKREGKIDEGAGKVKEAVDKVKDRLTDDD